MRAVGAVKKDTEEIPAKLEADDFLAELFFEDRNNSQALKDYLGRKAVRIDEMQQFEKTVRDLSRRENPSKENFLDLETHFETVELGPLRESRSTTNPESFLDFFESHRQAALKHINSKNIHESAVYDSRYPSARQVLNHDRSWRWIFDQDLKWLWTRNPHLARLALQALLRNLAKQSRRVYGASWQVLIPLCQFIEFAPRSALS